jgi:imidazolonepropionase-like amidohydrolase
MNRSAAILALLTGAALATATAQTRAFVGARVIDGTGKLPPNVEKIDVTGKFITPGLINTHGHVGGTQGLRSGAEFHSEENLVTQLGLYARYGITTVYSLGGDEANSFRLRDQQDTPKLNRARLFVSGPVLVGRSAEEIRQMADKVAATKPDILKIRVDDNLGSSQKMAAAVSQAAIEQAHKNKLRMAAHVFYLDDAKFLLKNGVDFIAHSIRDKDVDAEVIGQMKQRDICYCPTLTREISTFIYETKPAFFDDPYFLREADKQVLAQLLEPKRQEAMKNSKSAQGYKAALEVAKRNVKKLSDSGIRMAMGTDSGMPARFQGYFEIVELEMMAETGLTPMQVLLSATGDAARCMNASGKIGTIQPGAWADLLVLNSNPLDSIKNLRTIQSVYIAGNQVPRK